MARRSIRHQPTFFDADRRSGAQAVAAEFLSRRCVVCGGDQAYFGFEPPLVPTLVWACAKHRADVDPELSALPGWLR